MKDLKLEQKRSLSRLEAADQLEALAAALREGGEAELELDPWKLSLRIPSDLRTEFEVEVSDGEIELEIELKWPAASAARTASSQAAAGEEKAVSGRKTAAAAPSRRGTGGGRTSKRTPAKKS
ncbi:amphi-Trp domain-containing protein [Streptomyces sp. AS02]|uniref:amphi-Trp domain-containing protein n=1 Tax=Streptomyces sp. AS02 TaxID=2938946 RepID=UPI0020229BD8|nr:amphi-Trp domain-containing protein [Streptomyces sp. AS02]MCL8014631.1 amphi-Trp domain-containing protein [Streptomyces sp. AS02]